MRTFVFLVLLLVVGNGVCLAENPLPNAGFEDGTNKMWWSIGDNSSQIIPEAARTGKLGLRIGSLKYNPMGASVSSARLPVTPRQEFTLSFYAKGVPKCCGVYLMFANDAGKSVANADPRFRGGGGHPVCVVDKQEGEWNAYSLSAQAPTNAAFVGIWVHSFSGATGLVDFDDFAFAGIAPDAVAVPPAPPRKVAPAPGAGQPVKLPSRKSPPIIIIKLDDVKQVRGNISVPWVKVADFLKSRQIKGGFGVVCETLQEAAPAYVKWIKEHHDSGLIEFWYHGWDHGTHVENGVELKEFNGRSYEDQKARFDKSQKLALEKLGFAFQTFGPPGGGTGDGMDANTYRVMQADPYMKAWLYPQPMDDAGKALEGQGKVVILDRVWAVNFESAVGVPDFDRFVAGYAASPERDYFVLQGHPDPWGEARFNEFVRIIDFLVEQKAVFIHPSEYKKLR